MKKKQFQKFGKKNHQWVEKNPSYSSVHKWLARNFVKSKKCDFCESTKFIEWALKKGNKHDHDRDSYFCLCSSCHKVYDYTEERKKKLSISLKKVVHGPEWNKKVSLGQMGKKMSVESRRKMSIYKKNNPPKRNGKTGKFTS